MSDGPSLLSECDHINVKLTLDDVGVCQSCFTVLRGEIPICPDCGLGLNRDGDGHE